MLDCGLDICTILNYLPIPLIPSSRLASLPTWKPKDQVIPQLDGVRHASPELCHVWCNLHGVIFHIFHLQVIRECCNRFFIDGEPEFGTPQEDILDVCEIDAVLISNYLSMLALPFVTESPGFRGAVYATEPTLQMGRFVYSSICSHSYFCLYGQIQLEQCAYILF